MSEKRASLEIIAPTVEEAVAKGLEDLRLPENAVEVEVLDAGSRGLFGLGSRQARVRLTIKSSSTEKAAQVTPPAPVVEAAALPVEPAKVEPVQPEPARAESAPVYQAVKEK
ncbi:MAG TPA: Jag N-terminal domain-containing protein, partial [Anaerolineales bacterium]